MEVKIGVRQVSREVLVDSDQSADEVADLVTKALSSDQPLVLTDAKGQRVIVPAAAIGYVDISGELRGRVGFGS